MTPLELDLLDHMITGREDHRSNGQPMAYGAWMTACLESLEDRGYVRLTHGCYVPTSLGAKAFNDAVNPA